MEITVNGARETLNQAVSLTDYLKEHGYPLEAIVIEYNGEVIPAPEWSRIQLSGHDTLEILRFVGGG